jgi:photosystem II stability/assembly factor-like uncharacterized protein
MFRLKQTIAVAVVIILSSFFLIAQQTTSNASSSQKEKEPADILKQRADYFARQHGARADKISVVPRLKALKQLENMRQKEKLLLQSSPQLQTAAAAGAFSSLAISTTQWTSIGPAPVTYFGNFFSGRVRAFAVDSTNPSIVYVGAADGGVWKTTDGGQHWVPLTDTQPSLSIGSLAIDPNNPNTIYVGTGEPFTGDSFPGVGILKSTDGGSTWTNIQGPFLNGHIGGIAVDPNNSQNVLAAFEGGLERSTDGGNTWTQVFNSNPNRVLFDPKNPGVAYGSDLASVFKSTDSGATWTRILSENTADGLSSVTLSGSTLYAFFDDSTLFKSTDAGATWTQLTAPGAPFCQGQCNYNLIVGASPTNPNVVYVGSINMYHSNDGGATWGLDSSSHADNHAIAFSPDGATVYVGNDGGAWAAPTGTATNSSIPWTNLNNTLATLQFYRGISIAAGDPNLSLGGTQDNETERYNGTTTWTGVIGGDGFATAINPFNQQIMYGTLQNANLFRSTDAGASFSNIGPFSNGRFDTLLAMDPSAPQHLYTDPGSGFVFQSNDAGTTWTSISPQQSFIGNIAVAPTDSNTVYAVTNQGAAVTRNALAGTGSTWNNFSPPDSLGAEQIVVDPHDATVAYAARTRLIGPRVFRITGAGATWTDISGNLPFIGVFDIVVDPAQANTLYAATDIGVFSTTDGGTTWNTLVTGLPRAGVESLALEPSTRILRAATHGRSMWDLQLPPGPGTGTGTLTGTVVNTANNAPIAGATVSFSGGSTTTNASGVYQFTGVPSGTYNVTAVATGFFAVTESAAVSSSKTTTLNFRLSTGGKIAGTVTSSSGAAIPGASVHILGGSVTQDFTLTTNASGAYATGFVPTGSYTIIVSAAGFATQTKGTNVTSGQTSTVNFTLLSAAGAGALVGTVVNISNNAPISGATVSFSGGSTTTDSNGFYQFTNVVAGTYNVTATHTGFFSSTQSATVTSGGTTTLNFKLATGGKLAGTVKNSSGAAVSGATINISGGSVATTVTLTTSSTGAYATNFIPVGTYTITVSATGFTTQSKTATVNTGQTTTVNFTLSAGGGTGTLSGTVVNISTNAAISGATVSFSGGSTTTNSSGFYQFTNVAAGTYNVTASHTGFFSSTQSATVTAGATTTLNFKLATGGKLAGTVKNSSGAAISGATVKISGGSVATSVTLTTSSTGAYATNFIPVGTYTITVSAPGFTTQSKTATVNTGQTTTVNFVL